MTPLVEQAHSVIRRALAGSVQPCVTSSFQAECVALTHMLVEHAPRVPVLFLDTGAKKLAQG